MTKEQTQEIRERLVEERERISLTLQEHRTDRQIPEESIRDAGDRGERELERALEHRIGLDDTHLIQKIDLALQRLEEGTYGQCEICGVAISMERLLAKPSVSRCHTCQQAKEDHSNVEASH